jgi:hypothetical protein
VTGFGKAVECRPGNYHNSQDTWNPWTFISGLLAKRCGMSSEAENCPEMTSPGLELLRVTALLGAFAAQFYLSSRIANVPADYCLTRPLWLDEIHTAAIVSQTRAGQLLAKLSQGADCSPPGLHVVLWLISRATGARDEWTLRTFSCGVGLCGLVATYFLLRLRFPWRVSWMAVLGMWSSSPQLVQQMFEGRPYSFWFATAAILCLLLALRARGHWHVACVGAVGALMCLVHYFGIISLSLIAVSHFCCNLRDLRQRRLSGAALAGGVIGLLASLPVFFGQRAAVPSQSWIPLPTLSTCIAFIEEFIVNYALTLPVLAYALNVLLGRRSADATPENGVEFRAYAGACGLILLPVVLVVFSFVIEPALITRYAVPATLAYAPLIGLLSNKLHRTVLNGMAVLFFVLGLRGALVVYEIRPDYREAAPLVSTSSPERPLIVHWRVIAYPLFRYTGADPDAVRVSYLFRGNKLTRFDEWEQALARLMAKLFDLPKTIEHDELESRDVFYLLVVDGEEQRYTGWTAEPLDVVVGPLRGFNMTRSSVAVPGRKPRAADGAAAQQ